MLAQTLLVERLAHAEEIRARLAVENRPPAAQVFAHDLLVAPGGAAHLAQVFERPDILPHRVDPVSYTHLDVYKRQSQR